MSHAYIDIKYIGMISYTLRNFKWIRPSKLARYSCPICGDSSTRKHMARGMFIVSSEFTGVYCHNCGFKNNLAGFLKINNPMVFQEYILEVYKETGGSPKEESSEPDLSLVQQKPTFAKKDFLEKYCTKLSALPDTHEANQYINSRQIKYDDLWYTERFKDLVYNFEDEYAKAGSKIPNEPRIIIPFRNGNKELAGFQGRDLGNSPLRYVTIKKDNAEIVFGLDKVDFNKTVLVLEGALDATFIPNSIALNGSALSRVDKIFNGQELEKMIFCLDNEPRNPDIVKIMKYLLDSGKRVVIWNKETPKDVNNMILSGMTGTDIAMLIRDSVSSGLSGQLKLSQWKRC